MILMNTFWEGLIDPSLIDSAVMFAEQICLVESESTIIHSGEVLIKPCRSPKTQSRAIFLTFLSRLNLCILHPIDISLVCLCKHTDLKIFHSFMHSISLMSRSFDTSPEYKNLNTQVGSKCVPILYKTLYLTIWLNYGSFFFMYILTLS